MVAAIWLTIVLGLQSATPFWDHFQSVADVGAGRLSLILLDLDGDGRTEIFLAPALTCGNAGCTWQVYSPVAASGQARYLGEASFPIAGFRLTPSNRALTSCWHLSAFECELSEYRLENSAISRRSLGTCRADTAVCQGESIRISEWQRQNDPPVFTAEVASDLDLERLKWTHQGSTAAAAPRVSVPNFDRLAVIAAP
jgi:hypothetical protein